MTGQRSNSQSSYLPEEARPTSDYLIHLNFLPLLGDLDIARLYRKPQMTPQEPRPTQGLMAYRLPTQIGDTKDWPYYWVSFEQRDGFELFEASPTLNTSLATRILFRTLANAVGRALPADKFHIPDNEFIEELSFICRSHAEGNEELVVQPYYLRAKRQFGYLMDFQQGKAWRVSKVGR